MSFVFPILSHSRERKELEGKQDFRSDADFGKLRGRTWVLQEFICAEITDQITSQRAVASLSFLN